jgi:nitrate reductase delta subunit
MIGRRMDDQNRRDAWRVTSALLRYPDATLVEALPSIRDAVEDSKLPSRKQLIELIDGWLARDPIELQEKYVETFDLSKRCALHVSWFQYGDRRQRGMVLLKLKRRYMEFEMFPSEDELPDWLPLMLEFAAEAPAPEGTSLLQEWRAAIELIRRSLAESESEYTVLLDLVAATLPKLGSNLREAVDKLIEDGPPGDEVGLEPFGPDNDVPSGLAPSVIEYAPQPAQQGGRV